MAEDSLGMVSMDRHGSRGGRHSGADLLFCSGKSAALMSLSTVIVAVNARSLSIQVLHSLGPGRGMSKRRVWRPSR